MSFTDLIFVWILKFTIISFLLLGCGLLALRWNRQPIERIRLIQVSLASIVFAVIASQLSWLPSIELPTLPGTSLPNAQVSNHARAPINAHTPSQPKVTSKDVGISVAKTPATPSLPANEADRNVATKPTTLHEPPVRSPLVNDRATDLRSSSESFAGWAKFTVVLAFFLLRERMNRVQMAGVVLALTSIFILAR